MNLSNIQKYITAVVQIYVEGIVGEEVKSILNPRIGDLVEWTGSGFFVETEFGNDIIVTNAHVVKNARSLEIMSMLTSEEKFEVEIIDIIEGQEPDIAILKFKEGELERFNKLASSEINYLKLSSSTSIYTRGTSLRAIGYPMGMDEPNITRGEITNFVSGDRGTAEKYVTDAAINPGNSGGPSIDDLGNVIGVNTSIYVEAENIGFITPASFINIILNNIFNKKINSFADIGGEFQRNSKTLAQYLGQETPSGVIVSNFDKGGFLDIAGAHKKDVLLSINGKELDRHGICVNTTGFHRKNLFDLFKLIPISEKVQLSVLRNKKVLTLEASAVPLVEKKIRSTSIVNQRKFIDIWGLTIQKLSLEIIESLGMIKPEAIFEIMKDLDSENELVVVTHIKKGSTAYLQEWSLGEVISIVNGQKCTSYSQFIDLLENNETDSYLFETLMGHIGLFSKEDKDSTLLKLSPEDFLT